MRKNSDQSNAMSIVLVLVGTSSMILGGQFGKCNLIPSKFDSRKYQAVNFLPPYSLKHEKMPEVTNKITAEPLVEMPFLKRIGVKFNKPSPLDFFCTENSDGFMG